MDKNHKRSRLLIYPAFQLRLIVGLVLSHLVLVGVFFLTQLIFFYYYKAIGQKMGLPADHMFYGFLGQQQQRMAFFFVLASLVVMAMGALYSLLISHRVAGPIVRVMNYLNGYSQAQEPSPVRFREDDYFLELADAVNQFVSRQGKGSGQG